MRIAPRSFGFTIFLGLIAALPALSIDVSAPTLALLPEALGTTRTMSGLTLSLFMVGFGLGQLGGGTLSDVRGRRPVLLGGLTCFTLAGLACAASWSGPALVAFRFLQGFGAGSCAVISFAMVQDLFEGEAARAKRSYVTVIFGVVPILAPAIGAVLTERLGWRSVHTALTVMGVCLLAITWAGIAESRLAPRRHTGFMHMAGLAPLRDDARFVRLALANALSYGAVFAYIAGSPVVIIAQMGYPPTVFAAVFALTATALAAGALTNGRLTRRGIAAEPLVHRGLLLAAGATVALAVACGVGVTSGVILVPLLLAVAYPRGIVAPNMQHLTIERQRQRAGAAAAAVGLSQLLMGATASAGVAVLLPYYGAASVAIPMALCACGALAAWYWAER